MLIAFKSNPPSSIAVLIVMCVTLNLNGKLIASAQEPIDEVNPMIGTTGPSVFDYGGMIPGVATPFGMTHWTAVTRENKISVCPYNYSDSTIEGFLDSSACDLDGRLWLCQFDAIQRRFEDLEEIALQPSR
jgi:putative alpha-1,2-mannosidase